MQLNIDEFYLLSIPFGRQTLESNSELRRNILEMCETTDRPVFCAVQRICDESDHVTVEVDALYILKPSCSTQAEILFNGILYW